MVGRGVPCTVLAKKGKVWRQAGVSGGTAFVLIVRTGDGRAVEADAPPRLYRTVEVGDPVLLLPRRWYRAYPAVRALP